MGKFQSLTIGIKHQETFAWLGVFSARIWGPFSENYDHLLDTANDHFKLFWISCGEDGFLMDRNNQLLDLLKSKNVKHVSQITKGGHTWKNWRYYLRDFTQLIFQIN